jgi:small subunit ribosomal protein S4e
MHIKRKTISKLWPITRTGTKYLAVPSHNQSTSLPLVIVAREMLKIIKTKKELKKILSEKQILVNGKIVKEVNYPVSLFDYLSIPAANEHYKMILEGKKLKLVKASEKDTSSNIFKVIGKRMLGKNIMQINLTNGRNVLSNEKIEVGNFVLVDHKNKINKILPLEKDVKVIAISGKHMGENGKVKEIVKEGQNEIAKVKGAKEEFSTNINNLFVEM